MHTHMAQLRHALSQTFAAADKAKISGNCPAEHGSRAVHRLDSRADRREGHICISCGQDGVLAEKHICQGQKRVGTDVLELASGRDPSRCIPELELASQSLGVVKPRAQPFYVPSTCQVCTAHGKRVRRDTCSCAAEIAVEIACKRSGLAGPRTARHGRRDDSQQGRAPVSRLYGQSKSPWRDLIP